MWWKYIICFVSGIIATLLFQYFKKRITDNENIESETETDKIALLKDLLFQYDNLLHNRVNSWLLAESIFFLAVVAVWNEKELILIISILGIINTILFGFTSAKLYLRVSWLIKKYQKSVTLYQDYLDMKGLVLKKRNILLNFIKKPLSNRQWKIFDTGWLYSIGLTLIFLSGWIVILILKFY
ncbi:MAG: hypothetical protein KBC43_11590 [Bacteroidales bacterium]|nr:hypothetical protein [Bacteroidales bacterium]